MSAHGSLGGFGPTMGCGAKHVARNGTAVDFGIGMTVLVNLQQNTGQTTFLVPTAQLTFGRRAQKNR